MDKLQELLDEFEEKIKKEDLKNVDKDDPNGQYNFCIPKIKNYFIPFYFVSYPIMVLMVLVLYTTQPSWWYVPHSLTFIQILF